MTRRRTAIVTAFTVEVRCPDCGEPQPSPSGSHFWEPREVIDASKVESGKVACTACDEPLRIVPQGRVSCEAYDEPLAETTDTPAPSAG